jgi:hypothetical protein
MKLADDDGKLVRKGTTLEVLYQVQTRNGL